MKLMRPSRLGNLDFYRATIQYSAIAISQQFKGIALGTLIEVERNLTILVVDDDPRICRVLSRYLMTAGYRVLVAGNGSEMRHIMEEHRPDLVVLDLQLPGEHGLDLARELRRSSRVGIVILTGSGDKIDEIVSLEGGADDYLVKPVDERELLARIRSVLRRVIDNSPSQDHEEQGIIKFADRILDLAAHELRSKNGEETSLTSHEFQLLKIFVENPNQVMSRDQIMDNIAGRDWMPNDRSIDVLVGKLRKKIEVNPENPKLIKTLRGAGYKFTALLPSQRIKNS
jgi:two-component system OmpR family response regulator